MCKQRKSLKIPYDTTDAVITLSSTKQEAVVLESFGVEQWEPR